MIENRPPNTSQEEAALEVVISAWQEQIAKAAMSPRLQSRLAGQSGNLFSRFAERYRKLRALPRRARRATQKKWKKTLAGVALMLALSGAPASAAIINVPCGDSGELIAAVNSANDEDGAFPGPDTIVLGNSCIHTLTAPLPVPGFDIGSVGLPFITSDITIQGNGSTITRDPDAPNFRIMAVGEGCVVIDDVIHCGEPGKLTIQNTTLSGGSPGLERGGAIWSGSAEVTLIGSTISGNSANGGGGIYASRSSLNLVDSTISENNGAVGVGVMTAGGSLAITNSLISDNHATNAGGGFFITSAGSPPTVTMTNSTVSGNTADNCCGGFVVQSGNLTFSDSTITGNTANGGFGGGGIGKSQSASLTLHRTIVSGNASASAPREIFSYGINVTADDFNLFGFDGDAGVDFIVETTDTDTDGRVDIVPPAGVMPGDILDPLADNGGPTFTHALVSGSPAIDGALLDCASSLEDQRHFVRPAGDFCDIGAYEFGAEPPDNDGDGYNSEEDCDDNNPAINPGAAELCNGADENCNGEVDDNPTDTGASCDTDLAGVCAAGTLACEDGEIVCQQTTQPSDEVCDGQDNDCDGDTDESPVDAGQECSSGQPGVCSAGTTECVDGTLSCNPTTDPSDEVCDGLDNDCDGQTDDGLTTDADNDGFSIPGSCGGTQNDCNDADPNIFPGAPELCDSLDNDCDGQVDEGALNCCLNRPATIVGTNGTDIILGTPGNDVIVGLGGDDLIINLFGNDIVCGGLGNDTITGLLGNFQFDGGDGRDTCVGGLGVDTAVNCETKLLIP